MAKLRHIAITVPDPEKAAQFYMRAFGMKRVGETDWANARGVYLSDGTINLALLHYKTEQAAGARGKISCLDQDLVIPGMLLPVR